MKISFYVEGILKRKDLKISLQLTYSIEFLNIRFWILLDRNLEILTYDGGPTVRIQNIGRYPAVYVVNLSTISNKNVNFENSPKKFEFVSIKNHIRIENFGRIEPLSRKNGVFSSKWVEAVQRVQIP